MHEHGVERGVAVMTSAVRDAANGREFADEVAPPLRARAAHPQRR